MTGQELLDLLRIDVLRDNTAPYLWSDNLILTYLSRAETEFARRTHALLDDTGTITTEIGIPQYDLPAKSIFVASAAISTEPNDLGNYTRKVIPSNLSSATGTPSIFVCDQSYRKIRLYPVPNAVITINIRAARLPAESITEYTSPEIPDEYHLDLTEYVAWKCLKNNDVDGQSTGASDRHQASWNLAVADAKREFFRFRHGNNVNAVRNWTGKRR